MLVLFGLLFLLLETRAFGQDISFEPGNLGLFLFVDGLSYTFGDYNPTLHVQVRPTVRVKTNRFSGTLFYAQGFGDRYTGIDKLVTNDYTVSIFNKTLSYVGLSLRGLPFDRLFIEAAIIAAPHGVYQAKVESGIELFKKLFLTANAQTSSFGKYPELAMQGFSKNTGFGIGIQYQFGHSEPVRDLRERNIVPVFYPLVVSHEKKVLPGTDDPDAPDPGDPLSVSISGSPLTGRAPLSVDFTVTTRSGSSPFQYTWYFAGSGQSSLSGTGKEQHTYYQPGTYQVYVDVTDAKGNRASSNRLSVEVSASGKYTITAIAHDNAQVKPEGTTLAEPGGNYRFNLSARDGYKIDRVEVDGKNKGAILEYTFKNVTADHRIEAWAKANNGQKSFKITSIAQDGGYNDPEGIVQVEQSSSLKVRVAAKDGYRIRDVRVDGKSFGPRSETTFSNIEADHTIESFFQESLFTITAIQNPGGTISPAGTASIPLGGSQTYNVSVNPGSQLTDLLVDGQSVGIPQGNTYTFVNVKADHTIQPLFGQQTFIIDAGAEGGGSIIESGAVKVVYGSSKTFTFKPDEGYEVTRLVVDGISVSIPSDNRYTFVNVSANHSIRVVFSKIKFTITVIQNTGGTITPNTTQVEYGADIAFTITPLTSHRIETVKVDGGSYGPITGHTFKDVRSNHIIEALFAVKTYKITVVCDEGSYSKPGTIEVPCGASQTFTFGTADGKFISDVKIDHESKGQQSSWTLSNIETDHLIEVFSQWRTFEIVESHDTGGKVFINGQLNPGKVLVKWGEDVSLRFETESGSGKEVKDIAIDGQSRGVITTYTLSAVKENHVIHLSTQWLYFTVSETHGSGGMVAINGQPNPGSVKVRWGESATCTFIADPNAGKAIDHVTIDGQNAGNITTWTFNSIKENHAVDLVTKWLYFTVSEAHESGGQVFINGQMNPGSVQIRWGEAVTFNFDTNSNSGKEIRNLIMDGKSLGAVKTFRIDTIKENHTCLLQTQWIYYTIQVTYGLNGHIEPGTSLVKWGISHNVRCEIG